MILIASTTLSETLVLRNETLLFLSPRTYCRCKYETFDRSPRLLTTLPVSSWSDRVKDVINRETSSRTMITFPPFQNVVLLLGVLLALPLLVAFDSDVLHADCSPVHNTDRLMSISYMIINPSALGALSMALVPLLLHIIPILMLMSHWQMYALFISMFFTIAIPTTYSAILHQAASFGLLTAVIGAGWELPITSEYRNAILMSCGLTVLVGMYHTFVEHIGGTWSFYIGESIIAVLLASVPYNLTDSSQDVSGHGSSGSREIKSNTEPKPETKTEIKPGRAIDPRDDVEVASLVPSQCTLVIHQSSAIV